MGPGSAAHRSRAAPCPGHETRFLARERAAAIAEEIERLRRALEKLPPKCRRAFELRKFEELSQKQIAQRMGVAESTVEKHLSKALRLVMDEMRRGEEAPAATVVSLHGRRQKEQ